MECSTRFPVRDYDLAATLTSGQTFRWQRAGEAWEGVIHGRWTRLRQVDMGPDGSSQLEATAASPVADWRWLADYLRLGDDLAAQIATFPPDEALRAAIARCRGLRLLRQEPWECLASFVLSSTKQIVQIQQCVDLLCCHFGAPIPTPPRGGSGPAPRDARRIPPSATSPAAFAFPTAARLASATEAELRECKLGFRAGYLLDTADRVSSGRLDLAGLPALPMAEARAALMQCHGVGRKIADCVLLFSLGFDAAFPIDVWVERALRQLYFPKRRVQRARLERFAASHFGPCAGLAQQYLFHYLRTRQDTGLE